jgi:hypothetical protein
MGFPTFEVIVKGDEYESIRVNTNEGGVEVWGWCEGEYVRLAQLRVEYDNEGYARIEFEPDAGLISNGNLHQREIKDKRFVSSWHIGDESFGSRVGFHADTLYEAFQHEAVCGKHIQPDRADDGSESGGLPPSEWSVIPINRLAGKRCSECPAPVEPKPCPPGARIAQTAPKEVR